MQTTPDKQPTGGGLCQAEQLCVELHVCVYSKKNLKPSEPSSLNIHPKREKVKTFRWEHWLWGQKLLMRLKGFNIPNVSRIEDRVNSIISAYYTVHLHNQSSCRDSNKRQV